MDGDRRNTFRTDCSLSVGPKQSAEQANRTVIELVQDIFIETDLPKKLWSLVFDATLLIEQK